MGYFLFKIHEVKHTLQNQFANVLSFVWDEIKNEIQAYKLYKQLSLLYSFNVMKTLKQNFVNVIFMRVFFLNLKRGDHILIRVFLILD